MRKFVAAFEGTSGGYLITMLIAAIGYWIQDRELRRERQRK